MASRPLSELSPMGIRRNSPKFDQATKKPIFTGDSSPFDPSPSQAKSPLNFWQSREPSSPSHQSDVGGDYYPTSTRRASLERLQKSSRVKNSNMFARENSQIYDPDSSVIVPERPLASGRPLSIQYSGNAWETSSPAKKHRHARSESKTQIPLLSPSKAILGQTSPQSRQSSPQKSSLSQRHPDDDRTASSTPRAGQQQHKTVAFDTAPPQVNEYEMITPDPSSVASGSREGSYDLEDFDPDDSYDNEARHDDSFDDSLEDTGKTPVVLPEDWRFMSPKNADRGLAETFDDPFDEIQEPASPIAQCNDAPRNVSDVSHADSLNSEGDRRPLPPLPSHMITQLAESPQHFSSKPGLSPGLRHEPSPPRPASMSKAEILGMRNSPMPLDERLRLLALQENRPISEEYLPTFHTAAEQDEEAPQISRESIMRKVKAQREASDEYASDDTVEASKSCRSYADIHPDEPIPSRETSSDCNKDDRKLSIEIKSEDQQDRNLRSYPTFSDHESSPARSDYDRESSVIHHYVPGNAGFNFGLGFDEDEPKDTKSNECDGMNDRMSEETMEQPTAELHVPSVETHRMSLPEFTSFGSTHDDFEFGLRDYISPPPASPFAEVAAIPSSDGSSSPEQSHEDSSDNNSSQEQAAVSTPPKTTESSIDMSTACSAVDVDRPKTPTLLAPPEMFSQPEREGTSTPDSVIHHCAQQEVEEDAFEPGLDVVPEPEATVRAPGGKLRTRASNTVAELQNLRAAATGHDMSISDGSWSSAGTPDTLQVGEELTEEQTTELKRQLSDRMKLNLQVGDDLELDLEQEFNRLVEGQKRGYLMRQNTKLVVASHRQISGEQKRGAEAVNESDALSGTAHKSADQISRKTSVSKTWTTEPWNGKMRRQSSRRSNIGAVMGSMPPLPGQDSNVLASVAETSMLDEVEEGAERGRLFVKVVGIKNLDLPLPRGERSWFQLTLDNGLHCVTTAWLELGKNAPIGQEFELTVFSELDFSLTLQTKAPERPKSSASSVESFSRTPSKKPSAISRLLASPKKRREMEKKQEEQEEQARLKEVAAQRTNSQPTAWDLLHEVIGTDGSFARAVVSLDDHEQQAFGRQHTVDIPCFNSWATEDAQTTRSKHGGAQRKPPYKIGDLELQLLYIPKPKGVEDKDMPASMSSCLRAIKEAEVAAACQHEGFLSQQGGDCPYWRRRFFRLDGSNLTSYHETTRQRRANINLAKATKLIDEKSSLRQPDGTMAKGGKSRRRSAFADEEEGYMFIEEGFRIRFANGEVIDFYADSVAEKDSWMVVLAEAVGKESVAQKASWTSAVLARRKLRGDSIAVKGAPRTTPASKPGSRTAPNSPQKQFCERPTSTIYEKPLPTDQIEKSTSRPGSKQSNNSSGSRLKAGGSPSKTLDTPKAAMSPSKAVPSLTTDKRWESTGTGKSGNPRRAAVRSMVF